MAEITRAEQVEGLAGKAWQGLPGLNHGSAGYTMATQGLAEQQTFAGLSSVGHGLSELRMAKQGVEWPCWAYEGTSRNCAAMQGLTRYGAQPN